MELIDAERRPIVSTEIPIAPLYASATLKDECGAVIERLRVTAGLVDEIVEECCEGAATPRPRELGGRRPTTFISWASRSASCICNV